MSETPAFPLSDTLDVALESYQLKQTMREGWVKNAGLKRREPEMQLGESVAEHTALMSMLAALFAPASTEKLDMGKLLQMIAVHDMPEANPGVGDIPSDGTQNAEEKLRKEREAMQQYTKKISRPDLMALWEEFEAKTTPEARFAGDLDKIELLMQAYVYQRDYPASAEKLDTFWRNDAPKIKTSLGKQILGELLNRRNQLGADGSVKSHTLQVNTSATGSDLHK